MIGASWAQSAPKPANETKIAAPRRAESKPAWNDLSAPQRTALSPLNGTWSALSEAQKRKWIALSRNFDKWSPDEQSKLQARMREWALLSAEDRSWARLNFAETKKLSVDEKQAKWQAYQALTEDERRKLADQAPRRGLPGVATALQLASTPRLATVPTHVDSEARLPRISAAPHQLDPNTLLPKVDRHSVGAGSGTSP